MSHELLDAALDYAGRGWPVLPLKPRDKRPITEHGLHDATCDLELIRSWWTATPDANIGLRTGIAFDVVDADSEDAWSKVMDLDPHGQGPIATTGKGAHLLYQVSGIGNRAGVLPSTDYRGTNGYVVGPPSVHPNGETYRWITPPDAPLSPLPEQLRRALDPPRPLVAPAGPLPVLANSAGYGNAALRAECQKLSSAPEGTRNHSLNDAAFRVAQLIDCDLLEPDALEVVANVARQIGLSEVELNRTIDSAIKGAKMNPRVVVPEPRVPSTIDPKRLEPDLAVPTAPNDQGLSILRPFRRELIDLDIEMAEPACLAPGVYAECLTSISAPPGTGKGWIALDWCQTILDKGYAVLYLDGENGVRVLHNRLRRMGFDHEVVRNRLWLVCDQGRPWDIEDAAALDDLCTQAAASSPKGLGLVVLDTLPHFLAEAGCSENSSTDVTSWTDRFARIPQRRHGAAVVVLDHVAKPTAEKPNLNAYARGSGSKLGLVDVALVLDTVEPFNAHESGELRLFTGKDRTGTCTIPWLSGPNPDRHEGAHVTVNVTTGIETTTLRWDVLDSF